MRIETLLEVDGGIGCTIKSIHMVNGEGELPEYSSSHDVPWQGVVRLFNKLRRGEAGRKTDLLGKIGTKWKESKEKKNSYERGTN